MGQVAGAAWQDVLSEWIFWWYVSSLVFRFSFGKRELPRCPRNAKLCSNGNRDARETGISQVPGQFGNVFRWVKRGDEEQPNNQETAVTPTVQVSNSMQNPLPPSGNSRRINQHVPPLASWRGKPWLVGTSESWSGVMKEPRLGNCHTRTRCVLSNLLWGAVADHYRQGRANSSG